MPVSPMLAFKPTLLVNWMEQMVKMMIEGMLLMMSVTRSIVRST